MTTTSLILSTWLTLACGAELRVPTLQRVDFAAERPETWPRTNPPLLAMPRDEFEQLWAAVQPKPQSRPAAVLERAVYEASVVNHQLQGGTLSAEIRRPGQTSGWLPWTPCNLALSETAWRDGPAVFGADPKGRQWLLADRPQGEFTALWTLQGRRLSQQTEFTLAIPPALSSTVVLRVPRGHQISCPDRAIPIERGLTAGAWVTWRIDLGSRDQATLVMRRIDEHAVSEVVTYRNQVTADVSEDYLRFQIVAYLEVLDKPTQELVFKLPQQVELYSVTYGSEAPLSWSNEGKAGNRHKIRVRLPDAIQGEMRPLRFEGIWPRRPNEPTIIPQLELVDGVFLGARQTVTLLRPLELSAITMTGCREAAAVTPGVDGDSYQFQQFLPEALLKLEVRRPTSQLVAHTLSSVTFHADEWNQRTDMSWSTVSGSAFQVFTRIPSGWEVTDVDAFTSAGAQDRINWDTSREPDGSSRLRIELLEAVTPTAPRLVRLYTRQRRAMETDSVPYPSPRPLDVTAGESVLVLQGEGAYRVGLPQDPAIVPVTPSALPDFWRTTPLWESLIQEDERYPAVWCRSESSEINSSMTLEREPTPAVITAQVSARVGVQEIRESYELTVRPAGKASVNRVLAFLNEAGGELEWSVTAPVGASLVAQRLPLEQHALWRLPLSGELWEIRLPEGSVPEWRLHAERSRGVSSPVRIGLMVTPQSTVSESVVSVNEIDNVVLEWTVRGLQEIAHAPDDTPETRRWQYGQPAAELIGDIDVAPAQALQFLCDATLKSTLAMSRDDRDLHALKLVIRGLSRPLLLTLPDDTEWLTATVNGAVVAQEGAGQLRIPANTSDEPTVVDWVYRTTGSALLVERRLEIPWPTGFDHPIWTRFEWEICTPPGLQIDASASGLRAAEQADPLTWRRRLFGPLARSDAAPLFLPWRWEAWTTLTQLEPSSSVMTASEVGASAPTGWKSVRYFGPTPPDHLRLDVTETTRSQLLAWVALLSSALGVVCLRVSGWGLRDRLSALLLSSALAVSFCCSGVWTDIVGGIIAGIMIGGLLPRSWWQSANITVPTPRGVPTGSTQSFVISSPVMLLICLILGIGASWAADDRVVAGGDVATIYVPVDADGRPSQRLPFVYLTADLQQRLRALESQQASEEPTILIERADYRVAIGAEPRTGFSVTYRILTVSGPAAVCDLTLPAVTLSGPQSCLIDGRPGAVSALPGKRGLRLVIPASTAPVSAIGAIQFEPHEITLDFDHPWRRNGTGGSCELPLPRSANSRAEVTGLPPSSEVQLEGALGSWERSLDARQLTIALGPADSFRLQWQERVTAEAKAPQPLRVTTAESLKVSPAAVEVRCRSTVVPQSETLSRFAWDFPADTHFRSLQVRPRGQAEVTRLGNKLVRVEVDFYEPVNDQAVLETDFIVRHPSQQGEFVWRGVTPVETTGTMLDRPQRLLAISSVAELRVQPQSVENSGLVPVAADSVRDVFAGLTANRTPQGIYQVGTDHPIAFRWTTAVPRRRLLLWHQRGEVVGSRLRWTVEADLEATTQPPAYSHSFLVDRRLQIDQITVRERGADRLLRYTESRPVGSPHSRVTLWLTDPCLETQRITLSTHLPLSTFGAVTLPNVRCEDADLIGGRYELQSTRELRGVWLPGRGLKPLSTPDDRLDVAQHWIFEQTDIEPRATVRFRPQRLTGLGRALYAVSNAENGQIRLRARWEMPASDMLAGMQILVPRPWTPEQPPLVHGAELETTQETERGVTYTMQTIRRPRQVALEMVLRAPRADFLQRELPLPALSHDPGFVAWMAEQVHAESGPFLAGLSTTARADTPEWVDQWLGSWAETGTGEWSLAPSVDPPVHWPRSEIATRDVTRRFEWEEHQLWCWDDNEMSGTSRVWLEAPATSLTVFVPAAIQLLGADLDRSAAISTATSSSVFEISLPSGGSFRNATLYWKTAVPESSGWGGTFQTPVPTVQGRTKVSPVVTVFPPPKLEFLSNWRWTGNDWVDRALLRLEVLGDHLMFHDAAAATPRVAVQFRDLYEITASKLSHSAHLLNRPGSTRGERWAATVARVNSAAKFLPTGYQHAASVSPSIDDMLVDHPSAAYQIPIAEGITGAATWIPTQTVPLLLALASLLIGFPILRRAIRREWSPWFAAHPHAAVGMLGIVWWLCLSPSLAGLALACAAFVLGWNAHREGRTAKA